MQIISDFSPYSDASGAEMQMFHPHCGLMAFNYVKCEIRCHGIRPVKCFGNRAVGMFKSAVKKLTAEYQSRIDAMPAEWHEAHAKLYGIDQIAA